MLNQQLNEQNQEATVESNGTESVNAGGKQVTLSPDQQIALDTIWEKLKVGLNRQDYAEAVLAGAAGTGKSTTANVILERWRAKAGNVLLLAPTGKAAHRLSETTGKEVRTIHSAIYGGATEIEKEDGTIDLAFGSAKTPKEVSAFTLIVVDESSMVDRQLANALREVSFEKKASILWMGDHEQLPPVSGEWGVDLAHADAVLTTVHRQALESPILDLATCIRQGRVREFTRWHESDALIRLEGAAPVDAAEWYCEQVLSGEDDVLLITYTNRMRQNLNHIIRQGLRYPPGDIVPGEVLICLFNNHRLGIMNGQTFSVRTVDPLNKISEILGKKVLMINGKYVVVPELFDAKPRFKGDNPSRQFRELWDPLFSDIVKSKEIREKHNLSFFDWANMRNQIIHNRIQATYGYCITVHKSQGSQAQSIGFVSCPALMQMFMSDPENARRMYYTGVTRAQKKLVIFTPSTKK